ncbi:hypothetical protein ACQPZ2_27840 [Nocardia pseudovaccinii]|uniref:hypothetical protein n=1 Tax=Nocardia pseudovaccinii TaxID=189540 RepID=UPI003D8FEAD3
MSHDPAASFPAAGAFEDLLPWLVRRERRADRMLPIVGLSGAAAEVVATLTMFGGALADAVYVTADAADPAELPAGSSLAEDTTPGLTELRRLLYTLCRGLSADRFGRMRPLTFRHYRLVEWLMAKKLTSDNELRELETLLRKDFGRWGEELLAPVESMVGPLQRLLLGVVRLVLPKAVFRARTGGRIPGVGREFRWLMNQRYLAPEQSSQFVGFAHRLTENARRQENWQQLDKLLLHAFLEDLRVAYGRRIWRIRAARRTTYPVVVLQHGGTEVGRRLLGLVDEIRNETGIDDPLLLVSDVRPVPDGVVVRSPHRAMRAYRKWEEELPIARQRQRPRAWFLVFAVPTSAEHDGNADGFQRIPVPRPPWWARRALPVCAVVILSIAATGAAVWQPWRAPAQACGSGAPSKWVQVAKGDGAECLGYSAYDPDDPESSGRGYLFAKNEPNAQRLVEVQKRLYRQNRITERLAAQQPTRPFFTLVYVGQLTGLPTDYPAQSEDLEGLALAQYHAIKSVGPIEPVTSDTVPLVRFVLANSGPLTAQSKRTVEMLAPLVRSEPTIVGVIGFDQSRTATVGIVNALTGLGLPMVAPSLSADEMVRSSPLYFQISASNQMVADMVRQYVRSVPSLAGRGLRIYHRPDSSDLYTENMAADLHVLGADGHPVWDGSWDRQDAFSRTDGVDACDEVMFFAGRDWEFPDFLQSLNKSCGDQRVVLIADDSANRFMASAERRKAANSARPLIYVAKSGLVTCANKGQGIRSRVEFYNLAVTKDPDIPSWDACAESGEPAAERRQLHPLGEQVILGYDAVGLFARAVQSLIPAVAGIWTEQIPISAAAVWAALRDLPRQPVIESSSGVLDFSVSLGARSGRVTVDKWVGLLSVDQIWDPSNHAEPVMIFGCGRAVASDPVQCRPDPLGR